jgi:hypothetical protein
MQAVVRRVHCGPIVLWGALLTGLLGCAAGRGAGYADPPRRLQRLGAASAVASQPCAARLRDPDTGREYQLRGAGVRREEQITGVAGRGAGVGTVGSYVPVAAGGALAGPPLQVECTTLRVLGAAPP